MLRHLPRISVTLAVLALGGMLPAFGAAPAPTISGYAATAPAGVPLASAPPGAPVEILGTNFGTTPGTVAFGGVPAPAPASWSPTQIVAIVPAAASSPHVGPVTVTANGQTASGPAFTITAPPPVLRPGDLDPSFGTGGKVLTDFSGSHTFGFALAVQPDARIVVAGYASVNGTVQFALERYNGNGSLDASFGSGGRVLTDFGGNGGAALAVALQPDGRIVAAGGSKQEFALARYNANGSLDPSFGTGGQVLTDFGGTGAGASAVAVQPDGRIVVAGQSSPTNGKAVFALARYNANGSLDPGFGSGGKVLTDFGGNALAYAVALQPDGKIVTAGYAGTGNNYNAFALARYNVNGSLDASFGSGGTMVTNFGGSGQVLTDFGTYALARALAVQPDGRIVAAGGAGANGRGNFALARYNPNGSLDSGFGEGGKVLTDFGGSGAGINAMALQPDDQIVATGVFTAGAATDPSSKTDVALARYQGR